ncbi:MAG: shikimate dehydrogenase [Saprospiraceae bacterium]|nr:shikimate dehydrogenase [Saprospiraceae bacterium]
MNYEGFRNKKHTNLDKIHLYKDKTNDFNYQTGQSVVGISSLVDMLKYGLVGKSLKHSFSKKYFESKWSKEQNLDKSYHLFEIEKEELLEEFLWRQSDLQGFNVTIPYKEAILTLLDQLDPVARDIGAVNCVCRQDQHWVGYNTDGPAFKESLEAKIMDRKPTQALVLGSGGASKAVCWALRQLAVPALLVSRTTRINYSFIRQNWSSDFQLIVNTTPLGMFPATHSFPDIPYHRLNQQCYVYDLVYNPSKSIFLEKAEAMGAFIQNGYEMLCIQAELSEKIWNQFQKEQP